MGAWGIKALESDQGLDVVDILREYLEKFENKKEITLKEVIDLMIEEWCNHLNSLIEKLKVEETKF